MSKTTYTDKKIDEAFEIAMKIGASSAKDIEKDVFRKSLKQIAVAALDDARKDIEELMHKESNKYT